MKQSNPLPVIDGLENPLRLGLSDREIDKLTNSLAFKFLQKLRFCKQHSGDRSQKSSRLKRDFKIKVK